MQLTGIHHVTAITAQAAQNRRFYVETLGLRLVKKTVNQDDTSAYHLFYADGAGSPGTDLTFFDWPSAPARRGTHSITRTSLGSAYRGRSAEYPTGAANRDQFVRAAEAEYKRALQANASYGPAYYNLGLLYLDSDPFPSGGGSLDTMMRLNAAKGFLDQYKNMPGVDIKLYDERMKDVTKLIKRAEKQKKKANP